MYDEELLLEVLRQIRTASQTILDRFKLVKTVSDFTDSPAGREKLDSIGTGSVPVRDQEPANSGTCESM